MASIGIVNIKMPIRIASFDVLDTPTLFLLSFRDIDRLNIYLNNLENTLIYMSNSRSNNRGIYSSSLIIRGAQKEYSSQRKRFGIYILSSAIL